MKDSHKEGLAYIITFIIFSPIGIVLAVILAFSILSWFAGMTP